MDPGEELAGAGGFHVCSLPRAHASRSFSAGGAPSACLTPLMLRSLAAPLLITSESCFWVPPAMGVSHHPWRMLCPPPLPSTLLLCGECSPSTCLPCALCLNTHKTHPPPLAASHLWRGTRSFSQVPSLTSGSPGFRSIRGARRQGRKATACLFWAPGPPQAPCWVRAPCRPRLPETQGSPGTWHPGC